MVQFLYSNLNPMKSIIVIDKSINWLTIFQLILTGEGYFVKSFSKWKEGYHHIIKRKPDLVILEVNLGTADGRNLAIQLKDDPNLNRIPIILTSLDSEIVNHLPKNPTIQFLQKPFAITYFIEMIKAVLHIYK